MRFWILFYFYGLTQLEISKLWMAYQYVKLTNYFFKYLHKCFNCFGLTAGKYYLQILSTNIRQSMFCFCSVAFSAQFPYLSVQKMKLSPIQG